MPDLKEVMLRKYGPAPVWAWAALLASFIAAFMFFKNKTATKAPQGSSGANTQGVGGAGEFNSAQSQTSTDANGNQITSQYSASGPLTGIPGFMTQQAGAMPYSGGDVYVNYPAAPPSVSTPPPQQTTVVPDAESRMRQQLDPKFAKANPNSPWMMAIALPGETWKDVTARVYGFGKNYADVTDPKAKARVDAVTPAIQNINNRPGSAADGPSPWSVVFFN